MDNSCTWGGGVARLLSMSSPPQLPGYEVLHQLGAGGSGQVWAVRRPDGVRLAAKFVEEDEDGDLVQHEASLLQALRHEHVVRLHEVVSTDQGKLALVMQLAEGGSLAESLRTREHLTPGELVTVLCPVARTLHDLHGQGLMHGDLSPGNILFTQEGKPLIADLGFSVLAGNDDVPLWATESWAAPEVLAGEPLSPASDSYSLGAIAWTALVGAAPEPAALRPDLVDLAPWLDADLRDLVTSCLSHTASTRPSPADFAVALWQMASAAPAPVQGSAGRRSAVDSPSEDDLGSQLTRRIREEAQREGAPQSGASRASRVRSVDGLCGRHSAAAAKAVPAWRSPLVIRATAASIFLGLVAGGLILVGGGSAAEVDRSARTTSQVREPAKAAPRASADPMPATSGGVRTSSARSPGLASRSSSSSTVAPMTPTPSPASLLQSLVQARAHAWMSGHAVDLRAALVPGSAAMGSDEADLARAHAADTRYAGLSFTVRSARATSSTGTSTQIEAVVDRSAYTVTGPAGTSTVAAERGSRIRVSLSGTPKGLRISRWSVA